MSPNNNSPGNGNRKQHPPPGQLAPLPVAPDPHQYGLSDLERETDISGRTIRYYISKGLLPPAKGRGPGATYNLGHLLRLRMIGILKDQHFPLGDIKARLADLSDDDIAALLNVQTQPPQDAWRRIELHPDIELHVRQRSGKDRSVEKAADLIIGLSRPVIERMDDGQFDNASHRTSSPGIDNDD